MKEPIPELKYHTGKTMQVEPENLPLAHIATSLLEGKPAVALLEPGDATAYHLLIVPCWAEQVHTYLGRFGIPAGSARKYLLVVKLDQDTSRGVWIPLCEATRPHHTQGLTDNPWSVELLAWWISHLIEAIKIHERL